ncbi:MAG: PrgI family protein [Clostridia bacterium]|nr:PrgI family protein [Clostridia bacterium]
MDNIEITVFDEINDYKEKIYFFNFRQWIFAIIIVGLVVPTYILLKDRIGDEITSYIVIAIAGFLGFIGFVKIHELPAEKILPYWARHYFFFAKPIHYMTDKEYEELHQKKNKKVKKDKKEKLSKAEIKELKAKQKKEKTLKKANKKASKEKTKKPENNTTETIEKNENNESELVEKLSKLTKEQRDVLFKLLDR